MKINAKTRENSEKSLNCQNRGLSWIYHNRSESKKYPNLCFLLPSAFCRKTRNAAYAKDVPEQA